MTKSSNPAKLTCPQCGSVRQATQAVHGQTEWIKCKVVTCRFVWSRPMYPGANKRYRHVLRKIAEEQPGKTLEELQ